MPASRRAMRKIIDADAEPNFFPRFDVKLHLIRGPVWPKTRADLATDWATKSPKTPFGNAAFTSKAGTSAETSPYCSAT